MVGPVALYVHIPFCRARCAYCDFPTTAGLDHLMPAYVNALCVEIEQVAARWGGGQPLPAVTVYFGGGTPSLLPPDLLRRAFDQIRRCFAVLPDAEISLEANPGTVDRFTLRHLRALGVNRLSLGVQSAHDDELRTLGRIHTWAQALEGVRAARAAGFTNLSLDFIYGLPGQTVACWRETLQAALCLEPEHLSLYALTVEEGTPLAGRIARGELPAPDEETAAEMYELAEEMLAGAGFHHYEISNWARDLTRICRHNLTYWRNEPWLGVGAGAASWWGGQRWSNVRHPSDYVARIQAGLPAAEEIEDIPPRLEMGETMMLGLRLTEGVSDARFRARFGLGLVERFGAELRRLCDWGLLEWDGQVARLTARGRLLGNQVFQQFLP